MQNMTLQLRGTRKCQILEELKRDLNTSDAFELNSARFSSDSARAGSFSARLGSAREIFEPARIAKIEVIQAKIASLIR